MTSDLSPPFFLDTESEHARPTEWHSPGNFRELKHKPTIKIGDTVHVLIDFTLGVRTNGEIDIRAVRTACSKAWFMALNEHPTFSEEPANCIYCMAEAK